MERLTLVYCPAMRRDVLVMLSRVPTPQDCNVMCHMAGGYVALARWDGLRWLLFP